jgi:hypothetical protein
MRKHQDCNFFGYRTACLHGNDELMKQFLIDIETPRSPVPITLDFSKAKEVDELCSSCSKFESKHKSE